MFNVKGWKHIIPSLMFKERGETSRPFCILYSVTHLYALCRAGMSYSRSALLHTPVQQPPSLSFHIPVTNLSFHIPVSDLWKDQLSSTLRSWTSKIVSKSGPMPSAPLPTELWNAHVLTEDGERSNFTGIAAETMVKVCYICQEN